MVALALDLDDQRQPHIAEVDPASLLGAQLEVEITGDDGSTTRVPVLARIDTPTEAAYYEHGGILQYVLRQHLAANT